jgi:transcription factor WhiB
MGEWRLRAACRDRDPELWFPPRADLVGLPLHICRTHCPVISQCREWIDGKAVPGMVAGGEHWVTAHGTGKKVKVQTRAMSCRTGCPICGGAP